RCRPVHRSRRGCSRRRVAWRYPPWTVRRLLARPNKARELPTGRRQTIIGGTLDRRRRAANIEGIDSSCVTKQRTWRTAARVFFVFGQLAHGAQTMKKQSHSFIPSLSEHFRAIEHKTLRSLGKRRGNHFGTLYCDGLDIQF